jgi:hypothetical protein
MTAGSWIYIGSQGIVQGTYETYAECARQHFGGTLKGTLNVTAGLGGMGGAQPLAITMNEGVALVAEVEEWRIRKRLETRYLDVMCREIDDAIDKAFEPFKKKFKKPIERTDLLKLTDKPVRRIYKLDIEDLIAQIKSIEAEIKEVKNLHRPFLLHMAMKDRWVQKEVNDLLERKLGASPLVTIHKYPEADHAFARHGGLTYRKAEADEALKVTLDFFDNHLTK